MAAYNATNRATIAAKQKARRDADSTLNRRTMLKWKYDLTIEEFDAMREAQGFACAICRELFDRTPHVDHDHETGAVRGLLCSSCNTGLGHFKDDPVRIAAAAVYLSA